MPAASAREPRHERERESEREIKRESACPCAHRIPLARPRGGEDLYSHSSSRSTRFFRANPIASRHRVYPGIIQSARTSEQFRPGVENRRIVYANGVQSPCLFFPPPCRHSCTKVHASFSQRPLSYLAVPAFLFPSVSLSPLC